MAPSARRAPALLGVAVALLLAGDAAAAQTEVSLAVHPSVASYGDVVELSGSVAPAGGYEIAVVAERSGVVVASGRTRPDGAYRLTARARRPGPLVARSGAAVSPPAPLLIRPRLAVRLRGATVVGARLELAGTLRPPAAGQLLLSIGGAGERVVRVGADGRFRAKLPTDRTGRLCARLRLRAAAGFTAPLRARCATVAAPVLSLGARGPAVAILERRLAGHRYALRGIDGVFGSDTRDAVLALQKLAGLARDGVAGPAVWRTLERTRAPQAARPGSHIEVDKARQVLFEVRSGRVARIVHVSTGATGNTPVGTWRIYAKTPGFNSLGMYDAMYFLRGFAVHGYASVPPYPASHGCVRVPLWVAPGLYARWPVGSLVIVR